MAEKFSPDKYSELRYFLGDIRDYDRLLMAMRGIDIVVHAAAIKIVPQQSTIHLNVFELMLWVQKMLLKHLYLIMWWRL